MEEANETRCQGVVDTVATTSVVGRKAAQQTILPFANRPIRENEDVNYREMGVPTSKNELGHRVMKEYHFRTRDGQPIATCLHCANAGSDDEDVFLERQFSRTIYERSLPHATIDGIDPPLSQPSTHASPSSVANRSANSSRQASPFSDVASSRSSFQQPLRPMFDVEKYEIPAQMWSMAVSVMGLPFRTLQHPALKEAFYFSKMLPGYKLPSTTALRTKLLDKTYTDVKRMAE
ncbi:hypothetical protein R1flu_008503 [Riccia fluitans]|uniref:Uncharacterized protein n=1 Tax=Riccia fluitans TaxID=41844 RepID=A0ABD1YC33_9MARC